VLALVGDPDAGEVDAAAMEAGIRIAEHHLAEAVRLHHAGAVPADLAQARELLAWLHTRWPEPDIGLRDIYHRGPNSIRAARVARPLVAILEEHGWLVPVDGGATIADERCREAWRIVGGPSA
jgi:hypothetical protein